MRRVLCLLGTRSDITRLAPVVEALRARGGDLEALPVGVSGPAEDLGADATARGLSVRQELRVADGGSPWERAGRLIPALDPVLGESRAELVLVPGSGALALAGALAGCGRGIPVAWLRAAPGEGDVRDGLPQQTIRRLIDRLATLRFAPDAPPERIAEAIATRLRGDDAPGRSGLALSDFVDAAQGVIEEITPEEAKRILETAGCEGWHFVDVREPDEFAAGHLPGARSSPRGFLEVKADLVHGKRDPWFEDRRRKLILYCGGGHRSALAARTLQEMGFGAIRSMAEGFTGWTQRDYPVQR